jgi:hypothetical protein
MIIPVTKVHVKLKYSNHCKAIQSFIKLFFLQLILQKFSLATRADAATSPTRLSGLQSKHTSAGDSCE